VNLFLHIGTWKTGTSSIQHYLRENRENLRRQGYLYPCTGSSIQPGHHLFPWALSNSTDVSEYVNAGAPSVESLRQDLMNEIAGSSCDNIIISSEGLYKEDHHRLSQLFSDFDIKIIIYLRKQDSHIMSAYKQLVCRPPRISMTFDEYLAQHRKSDFFPFKHFGRLEKLSDIYGFKNIIAKRYERKLLVNNDIIQDFMSIFPSIDISGFSRSFIERGGSLNSEAIELLRAANEANVTLEEFNRLVAECSELQGSDDDTAYLSAEERADLMQIFAEDNIKLAEKYFS
jgi:hypothetical protein